jgi:hypothetical protein
MGDVRATLGALRQQGVEGAEIQARFAALIEDALMAVMTDAQKEIYAAAQQGIGEGVETRSARVFVLDDAGVPHPVTVTVGISDTGFTEFVRGELIDGQQVVVGASAATLAAQAAGDGGGRPRFGF